MIATRIYPGVIAGALLTQISGSNLARSIKRWNRTKKNVEKLKTVFLLRFRPVSRRGDHMNKEIIYYFIIGLMFVGVIAYVTGCVCAYTEYGNTPIKDVPAWAVIYFQNRG